MIRQHDFVRHWTSVGPNVLAADESAEPVWHLFPLFISGGGRDELREHLTKSNIRSGVHYPTIIPDQVILQRTGAFEIAAEPANARRLASSELSLPIHPFLTKDEVAAILQACNTFQA